MARRFSGTAEAVRFASGTCVMNGACTIALVVRRNVGSAWQAMLGGFSAANVAGYAMEVDNTNHPSYSPHTGGGSSGSPLTVSSTLTDWSLIAMTITGTSAGALMYLANVTTGAAIAVSGTTATGAPDATISYVEVGDWEPAGVGGGTDDLNGWVAVAGWWNSVLTSAQVDALRTNKATSDWTGHAVAPAAVWEFNGAVGSSIQDLTGHGANQSAIAGTTQDGAADPPSWVYTSVVAAPGPMRTFNPIPLMTNVGGL